MLFEACIIGCVSAVAVLFFGEGVTALTRLRMALCDILPAKIVLPAALGSLVALFAECSSNILLLKFREAEFLR